MKRISIKIMPWGCLCRCELLIAWKLKLVSGIKENFSEWINCTRFFFSHVDVSVTQET